MTAENIQFLRGDNDFSEKIVIFFIEHNIDSFIEKINHKSIELVNEEIENILAS